MKNELKLKRRQSLARMTVTGREAVYLGIIKLWHEPRNVNGYYFECTVFNKHNPLLWLMLLLIIPFAMLHGAYEYLRGLPGFFVVDKRG